MCAISPSYEGWISHRSRGLALRSEATKGWGAPVAGQIPSALLWIER